MCNYLSLETKESAITFDSRGKLKAIYNKITKTPILNSMEGVGIFSIQLGDRLLSIDDFDIIQVHSCQEKVTFTVTGNIWCSLEVKVVDCDVYRLVLEVMNRGADKVKKITFPELRWLSFNTEPESEFFTLPIRTGFICSLKDVICSVSTDKYKVSMVYPVPASMQWIDFFTITDDIATTQGLYLGCHDCEGLYKVFHVSNIEDTAAMSIEFPCVDIEKDEHFISPPVFIYVHRGDWHAGAKLYRAWASSWMYKPHPPMWFIENPAWFWSGCKGQYSEKPSYRYKDIVNISSAAASYNVKTVHLAGWTEHGHDAMYPDYRAGDSLGGEEGLIASVNEIKKNGNYIALYVNGRIVDPAFKMDKYEAWEENAVHVGSDDDDEEEGEIVKEKYGKVEFAVMCPGAPWWRQVLKERVRYIVENYNVNGIYIDQVCGAIAHCCHSKRHLHDKPNRAWGEYRTLLAELRGIVKSISPGIYLSTEGVNDILGQFFDIQQAHNDWSFPLFNLGRPFPEIFRYTLPWMYVVGGPVEKDNFFLLNIAHLLGGGFDCVVDFSSAVVRRHPATADGDDFMKDVALTIHRHKNIVDICYDGEVLEKVFCSDRDFCVLGFMKGNRIVVKGGWIPWEDGRPTDKRKPPARIKVVLKDILKGGKKVAKYAIDDTKEDITAKGKVVVEKEDIIIDFEFRYRVVVEVFFS